VDESGYPIDDDPWEATYRSEIIRDRMPVPRVLQDQTPREEAWRMR
jgi:hypothetical protein